MDSLGERIVYYRKRANLRQKDLAAAVGVSPSVLNYYEKNRREPTALTLANLAEALNTTGDALLGLEHPDLIAQNKTEFQALHALRGLNRLGQKKVLEYMSDLAESSKYTERGDPQS